MFAGEPLWERYNFFPSVAWKKKKPFMSMWNASVTSGLQLCTSLVLADPPKSQAVPILSPPPPHGEAVKFQEAYCMQKSENVYGGRLDDKINWICRNGKGGQFDQSKDNTGSLIWTFCWKKRRANRWFGNWGMKNEMKRQQKSFKIGRRMEGTIVCFVWFSDSFLYCYFLFSIFILVCFLSLSLSLFRECKLLKNFWKSWKKMKMYFC